MGGFGGVGDKPRVETIHIHVRWSQIRRALSPAFRTHLLEVVGVEVARHLLDEAVAVADVDERLGVGELGVHEECLHLLRVVHRRVPAHALHLLLFCFIGEKMKSVALSSRWGGNCHGRTCKTSTLGRTDGGTDRP